MVSRGSKFALFRAAAKPESCFGGEPYDSSAVGMQGNFEAIGGGLSEGSGTIGICGKDGASMLDEEEVNSTSSSVEDFRAFAVARLLAECFFEGSSRRDLVSDALDPSRPLFFDFRIRGDLAAPIDEA
jgi:hypothetical protein